MLKAHVVCENVDGSSMLGSDTSREDQNLSGFVTTEHDQFGVELESLGVVQINIAWHGQCGRLNTRCLEHAEVRWSPSLRL
jgi:hypothetical protein